MACRPCFLQCTIGSQTKTSTDSKQCFQTNHVTPKHGRWSLPVMSTWASLCSFYIFSSVEHSACMKSVCCVHLSWYKLHGTTAMWRRCFACLSVCVCVCVCVCGMCGSAKIVVLTHTHTHTHTQKHVIFHQNTPIFFFFLIITHSKKKNPLKYTNRSPSRTHTHTHTQTHTHKKEERDLNTKRTKQHQI